jgi:glycosyltransferase involved in cell wall biosynthesis
VRVLYFSRDYTPHDHRFLSKLSASDHEVHYLRLERGLRQEESRPLPPGVDVVAWEGGRERARLWDGPRLVAGLRRVLREIEPEVVHAGPVQRSAFLTALAGFRPLVTMSWGSDLLADAQGGPGRWAARYTLARSAVLVCDCQAVRQAARRLGMPDDRIVVFPWGVDLTHFSPGEAGALRGRLGLSSALVVLSTRSWEPIYGVDTLVKGFIRVASREPDLHLLMLGDGSLRSHIERMLGDADLLDRVHFPGQVAYVDLPAYYRAADVYVSASHSDGSSISLLEAMACGLPGIVSDIPGNREWVTPEVNGWLFPDGDAEALAETLLTAKRMASSFPRLGARARATAVARADWGRNFKLLLNAYDMATGTGVGA